MPDTVFTDEINFKEGIQTSITPKLSIHETGRVHVQALEDLVGPLFIPPLAEWKGQHAASVGPEHLVTPKSQGQTVDHVLNVPDQIESLHLAVYIAGDRPSFEAAKCPIIITLKRRTLQKPLYVALKFVAQEAIGIVLGSGITILAGWNPLNRREEGFDYIYIRGE
jgi:hypothetical protein